MTKFPADAPIRKVIGAFERLGFRIVREGNHIALLRENEDGTRTSHSFLAIIPFANISLHLTANACGIAADEFSR